MRSTRTVLAPLALATALTVTACGGGDTAEAGTGPLAGTEITVGSKSFAENILLGHMSMLALADAGATVEDQTGIESSANVRTALTSGDVDLYWEYTGTGWISYLGETEPLADPQEQFDAVAEADLAENGIVWLARSPINNSYALAAGADDAEQYGLEAMSDVTTLLEEDPDAATICVESEFAARDDGLPGVQEAYDLQDLPAENIKTVGEAIIYTELRDDGVCTVGEVFTTDARIAAFDLVVLEDDRTFFPIYNAAPTVREETLDASPEIAEILEPIAAGLDNESMAQLAAEVDIEGRSPEDVAEEWMESEGLLG